MRVKPKVMLVPKAHAPKVASVSSAVDQSLIKQVQRSHRAKAVAPEQMANAVRALKATVDLPATKSAANIAVLKVDQITLARRAHPHRAHAMAHRARTMAHRALTAAAMDPAITIAVHITARRRATVAIQRTAAIRSPTTDIVLSVPVMQAPRVKAPAQKANVLKGHVRIVQVLADHVRMRRVQTHRVRIGQTAMAESRASASHAVRVKPVTVKHAMATRADTALAATNLVAL